MHGASLDRVTDHVVRDAHEGGSLRPATLLFLLRRYVGSGREDCRELVERGLADGLTSFELELDPVRRFEWLELFAEAAAVSADEGLAETLRRSIGPAVARLEQLIASTYEPGAGLEGLDLQRHLGCASALLTAFALTARLPYSMLAEELLSVARREWWLAERGAFDGGLADNCLGVRLLCRLAALHEDPEYVESAVVAGETTYAADARRVLDAVEDDPRLASSLDADYGLALLQWSQLTSVSTGTERRQSNLQ